LPEARDSAARPSAPPSKSQAHRAEFDGPVQGATDGDAPRDTPPGEDDPDRLPISGWVLDQLGEPVEAIAVQATMLASSNESTALATVQTTTTDGDGYFELQSLAVGDWQLRTAARTGLDTANTVVRAWGRFRRPRRTRGREDAHSGRRHCHGRDRTASP
jgi:hypothetical protein